MKMIKQRLMGVVILLITAPLGLYMLFPKNYILYDGEPVEMQEPSPRARRHY